MLKQSESLLGNFPPEPYGGVFFVLPVIELGKCDSGWQELRSQHPWKGNLLYGLAWEERDLERKRERTPSHPQGSLQSCPLGRLMNGDKEFSSFSYATL